MEPSIPQIKPKQKIINVVAQQTGAQSILIPKLNQTRSEVLPMKPDSPKPKRKLKGLKILAIVLGILVILAIAIAIPALNVYNKAKDVYANTQKVSEQAKAQNLPGIKNELANLKTSTVELKAALGPFGLVRPIPYVGVYVSDANHAVTGAGYLIEASQLLVVAIEPYADIIGFTGGPQEAGGGGDKTTQERLDFVIAAIPDLISKVDEVSQKMQEAKKEIEQIDPNRYPEKVGDTVVREKLSSGLELFNQAASILTDGKPLLEASPHLLGLDKPRSYMVIFQNDKELRPTGGFITAYSITKVDKARFSPVSSNDIYNLDSGYTPSVPAPAPVVKYLKGPYVASPRYRLRDMNFSPDFFESMELFSKEIAKAGIRNIDGIIAVDTQLLVNLLNVLGPIGVSGFGNFSTEVVPECNCPQVIYELESFADIEGSVVWDQNDPTKIIFAPPNYENRKKIIGPLMNSVLANALGQPKDKLPALFDAAFKSLNEKHVLFYMFDDTAQAAVESFNIAGRIESSQGDYLHINDANLGGRKSNLYVTQEVLQEFSVARDGTVEKTLTLTYKNTKDYDGWLNSVLPNWVRVYVPKGSEQVSFEGVEDKQKPYEEFDKTVFAGYFELRPQGVVKLTLKYKLPFKAGKSLDIFIQKQPGTDSPLYSIIYKKFEEEFFLRTDKEFKLKI
jgi:hypothetical protein